MSRFTVRSMAGVILGVWLSASGVAGAQGTPADYARALVHVAEAALNPPGHAAQAALAFAGDREPSSPIGAPIRRTPF